MSLSLFDDWWWCKGFSLSILLWFEIRSKWWMKHIWKVAGGIISHKIETLHVDKDLWKCDEKAVWSSGL